MIVGILAGERKKRLFTGDKHFFKRILKEIEAQNGKGFVFTPTTIHHETITGFIPVDDKWVKKTFAYPNVVYNRLPTVKIEKSEAVQTFFSVLLKRGIPYFNHAFIDKWETYSRLHRSSRLAMNLPQTELLTDTEKAFAFLKKHRYLYVKPIRGQTGMGIFTLAYQNENSVLITTHSKRTLVTRTHFQQLLNHLLRKSKVPHMLQQGIRLMTMNDLKYDVRLLLLRPKTDWKVIGIGIRAAERKNITTHVMHGGKILPLQNLKPALSLERLTFEALQVAKELSIHYPALRECSLDVGRDEKNQYWLFEVNTKPMAFDEKDIEHKRMKELVKAFHTATTQTKPI